MRSYLTYINSFEMASSHSSELNVFNNDVKTHNFKYCTNKWCKVAVCVNCIGLFHRSCACFPKLETVNGNRVTEPGTPPSKFRES